MKISKKSWHFKLIKGLKLFEEMPKNLCMYYLQLFMALLTIFAVFSGLFLVATTIGAEIGLSAYFKLTHLFGNFLNLSVSDPTLPTRENQELAIKILFTQGFVSLSIVTLIGWLSFPIVFIIALGILWASFKITKALFWITDRIQKSENCAKVEYID